MAFQVTSAEDVKRIPREHQKMTSDETVETTDTTTVDPVVRLAR